MAYNNYNVTKYPLQLRPDSATTSAIEKI